MATARRAARREPTRNMRTHFLRHHPRTVSWLAWAQWTAYPARAGRAPTRTIAFRLEGSGRHFGLGATSVDSKPPPRTASKRGLTAAPAANPSVFTFRWGPAGVEDLCVR